MATKSSSDTGHSEKEIAYFWTIVQGAVLSAALGIVAGVLWGWEGVLFAVLNIALAWTVGRTVSQAIALKLEDGG